MVVKQSLTIDFAANVPTYKYIQAKQGDHSSRFVEITLTNNGVPYVPPSGTNAKFRAQKPDGTMILNPATVGEDGRITVELTEQTLAVPGDVIADIYLTDTPDSALSSASFIIRVAAAPTGEIGESSNEFLQLMEMVKRAETAARDSAASAETASQKATEASGAASAAQSSATESANSAKQASAAKDAAISARDAAKKSEQAAASAASAAANSGSAAAQSAQAAQAAAKQAEGAKNGVAEAETRARQSADTATQKAQDAAASAQKAQQAANAAADKLPLAGGRMTGAIDMGGQGITNLKAPANDGDAVSKGSLLELVYPIGSVYMSANDTSPALLFGGSWVKVEGKFLLGTSADYPVRSQGGQSVVALTEQQLPSLRGEVWFPTDRQTYAMISGTSGIFKPNRDHTQQDEFKPTTGYGTALSDTATYGFKVDVGGNAPHNNMPPYFAVNIWRRIK